MFADSFRLVSIHCIAQGLGASFLYKCPALRDSSLRQHRLVVMFAIKRRSHKNRSQELNLKIMFSWKLQRRKTPHKGADGHRRQSARLVAAYLQSQSQAFNLGQRRDKTQWILMISTLCELRSHVTANGGEIQKSGSKKL